MHELPAAKGILEISLNAARNAGSNKINTITLLLGEMSSFIDESIKMYFDELSKGTVAEGARLVFKRTPATLICRLCGKEFGLDEAKAPDDNPFGCPKCGGMGRFTEKGMEFSVESIEVEDQEEI